MIQLREIKDQMVDIYAPDGTLLGRTDNLLSFTDLRIQIMEAKVYGYYIMFEGQKVYIDENGRLPEWPKGLFDIWDNQLDTLIQFNMPKF